MGFRLKIGILFRSSCICLGLMRLSLSLTSNLGPFTVDLCGCGLSV